MRLEGMSTTRPSPRLLTLIKVRAVADERDLRSGQRVLDATILHRPPVTEAQARVHGVNPANLTRQINQIQVQRTTTARANTQAPTADELTPP